MNAEGQTPLFQRKELRARLLVAAAAVVPFLPALTNAFVDWDDVVFLVKNPGYQGLWPSNLAWMLTSRMGGHWHPLTWLSFGLDYSIWGLTPFGYHLTNIALHAAAALAFYAVAHRLLRSHFAAAAAAVLFAAHPLRVESVAWAIERRDVLSGLFYLLAIKDYLDRKEKRSLVFFACSLLSKAVGVTLPFALLILDWLQNRKEPIIKKWPYFALAAGAALVNAGTESFNGALEGLGGYPLSHRLAASAYSLAFYVEKTLVPTNLLPIYEFPAGFDPFAPQYLAAGVFALAVTAAAVLLRKKRPELLAGWTFYALTLLPTIGLVRFGPQIAADRYSYLSCLPFALFAGAGLERLSREKTRAAVAATCVLALTLSVLTWRQCAVWKDTDSLWAYVLDKAPHTAIAHHNVARRLDAKGLHDEAIVEYRKAIEERPAYALARNNLGLAYLRKRDFESAEQSFRAALDLNQDYWEARANLGLLLAARGDYAGAKTELERAVALQPQRESLKRNLALVEAAAARQAR